MKRRRPLKGVAGRHEVSIDTSADTTNFTPGSEYSVRLTAGTADSVSLIGVIVGEWSIANRTVGSIAANAMDVPTMTPDLSALLCRSFLSTVGVTTGPASADAEWTIAGLFTGATGLAVPYFKSKAGLGFIWTDGSFFYLTSTAPGVTLPAGYYKTATGANVAGPYTAQGTAAGVPVVTVHGNAILNSAQPNGTAALAAVAPSVWTDLTAGADFATANSVGNLLIGGLINGPGGVVAAGSSTTSIVVTGNASMTAVSGAYATATVLVNGQFRKVAGHTFSAGAHTFTLGTGTGANGPLPTGLPVTGTNLAILGQ